MSTQPLDVRARRLAEEVINQGDLALAEELVAADYVHHTPGSAPAPGMAGLIDGLTVLRSAFPDFHVIVEDAITQGDRVMMRLTAHGTHEGSFLGVAPTGRKVTFQVIDINRAAPDGTFVEHWSSVDLFGVLQQLGALPAFWILPPP